ncbi:MAG: type II toxin-antitoxin system VapC family toxin [Crocosphaera sp.]|nr:type II toxin-antitoxin system VapC family toxin [Crocosphaera sp.]
MKFLLDTHTFLWYLSGDSQLSLLAKETIENKENLYFSTVSLWEIAIKINMVKLTINRSLKDLITELNYMDIYILPINVQDIEMYPNLTLLQNHRDPFDRMLITQAMNRQLIIVTKDSKFDAYGINRLW